MPYFDLVATSEGVPIGAIAGFDATTWLATPASQNIAQIARHLFSCPTAFTCLFDPDGELSDGRRSGLPLKPSFGTEVVRSRTALLVPDAREHPLFRDNLLVVSFPYVRFYTGVPIYGRQGEVVGVISVVDYAPRGMPSRSQMEALESLGSLVADQVERFALEQARPLDRAQFERIAGSSNIAVLEVNAAGFIVRSNAAARGLLGADQSVLHLAPLDRFLVGWEHLCAALRFAESTDDPIQPILVEAVTAARALIPVLASICMWLDEGAPRFRIAMEKLA